MKKIRIAMLLALVMLVGCACSTQPEEMKDLVIATPAPTTVPVLDQWPEELTSLAPFEEYDSFEYAGQTATGWEISLICTLDQLEEWRSRVEAEGTVYGEFSVFHNEEYVVQISESYATTQEEGLLRVNLYLTRVKEQNWPEEMTDIPAYNGQGAVTAEFAVDTVYIENWKILEATLYGETQQTFEAYLDQLVDAGFEEMQGEDGSYYLRTRGEVSDQVAYEFGGDATVTVTWAICPTADLAVEE